MSEWPLCDHFYGSSGDAPSDGSCSGHHNGSDSPPPAYSRPTNPFRETDVQPEIFVNDSGDTFHIRGRNITMWRDDSGVDYMGRPSHPRPMLNPWSQFPFYGAPDDQRGSFGHTPGSKVSSYVCPETGRRVTKIDGNVQVNRYPGPSYPGPVHPHQWSSPYGASVVYQGNAVHNQSVIHGGVSVAEEVYWDPRAPQNAGLSRRTTYHGPTRQQAIFLRSTPDLTTCSLPAENDCQSGCSMGKCCPKQGLSSKADDRYVGESDPAGSSSKADVEKPTDVPEQRREDPPAPLSAPRPKKPGLFARFTSIL